jgi:hypothetical protein
MFHSAAIVLPTCYTLHDCAVRLLLHSADCAAHLLLHSAVTVLPAHLLYTLYIGCAAHPLLHSADCAAHLLLHSAVTVLPAHLFFYRRLKDL